MQTALGIVAVVLGAIGLIGQLVSVVNFKLAQQWGLQEKEHSTDPLYWRLERNTALWDLFVIWTLPVAGVLMLLDHSWWPFVALVAGGVYADLGGREVAKVLGLRSEGVRIGRQGEVRFALAFLGLWSAAGVIVGLYALFEVV